ncbi:hypothetical protein AX15_006584 [Amanita polypyramis BW_CC]|nr:hypothetical protein AX15_006584 [Amanita polypyramis BW_CC]
MKSVSAVAIGLLCLSAAIAAPINGGDVAADKALTGISGQPNIARPLGGSIGSLGGLGSLLGSLGGLGGIGSLLGGGGL